MKKRVLSLLLVMLLILSACGKPNNDKPRVDHTITVSEDTYVLNKDIDGNDKSNTNFNNDTILHLKSTSGYSLTRYIYFKFDVSSLKGDNDFTSIELGFSIYQKQNGNKQPATINVYGCTSNWNGKDVTYNNRPVAYSLICSRNDITAYNTEYTFPVTDYIRKHIKNGDTTVAFMLQEATESPMQVQIYSKENSAGYTPNLFVSYSKEDYKYYTPHEFEFLPKGLDKIVGNIDIEKYTITASEDTYVSGGDDVLGDVSNVNFGNSSILDLKGDGKGQKYYRATLLKFDLSNYKNKSFKRAVLQLNCISAESTTGISVNVYKCTPGAWRENQVTYNSRPSKGELITTAHSLGIGTINIDLTNYIKGCISQGINEISFYLEGTESKRLQFNSTESYENVPKIVLYKEKYFFGTNLTYKTINPWSYAIQLVNDFQERWEIIKQTVGTSTAETITKIDSEYANIVGVSKAANGDDTVYTNHETRILDTLTDYTYNNSESNMYDQYGGYMGGIKYKATGYFRVQFIDGRWWLIDPLGYPFFSSGMSTVNTGTATQKQIILDKYETEENWAEETTERLYELGFNSGTGTNNLLKVEQPISLTVGLSILSSYGTSLGINNSNSGSTTFVGGVMPVFDPMFIEHSNSQAKSRISSYVNNPNIIGWTSDNELHSDKRMLDNYLNCDPSKIENIYSYATAWTFMYKMTGKTDISINDVTDEHRALFKAMVYDRYYNVVTKSIKMVDTNHMLVGSRYLVGNFNDEYVMKVTGYYCDVITVNYYGAWTPNAELMANVQKWTNTPFLVTEAYAKGMDVCTEESGLTNQSGAGFTCRTQLDRAMFYQNFTLQLLESKYCVGYNWFMYWDNDPTDTTADLSNLNANKGIVNNQHEEYSTLTSYMQQLNLNKYSLIKYFDER